MVKIIIAILVPITGVVTLIAGIYKQDKIGIRIGITLVTISLIALLWFWFLADMQTVTM